MADSRPEPGSLKPQTLYATVGLPASGKSTWAKACVQGAPAGEIVRVNRDDLRAMMYDSRWGGAYSENVVKAIRDEIIMKGLELGRTVICDDTNFTELEALTLLAQRAHVRFRSDAEVVIVDFRDVHVSTCVEWNQARRAKGLPHVPATVIHKMYRDYVQPWQDRQGEHADVAPAP